MTTNDSKQDPTPGRDDPFGTDELRRDLKRRSVRGGAASLAGHAGKVGLALVSTMVLSRLLTPADFGLVAMVLAVIGFSTVFRDLGLSAATVQHEGLRHDQASTLFWLNLATSAVIASAILALAPLIAWFYAEPLLFAVTCAFSVSSLIGGLSIQHEALLRRRMRFGALVGVELGSTAVGVGAAVSLALLGGGYWSLVALHVVAVGARTALVWVVSGWRPGAVFNLSAVRSMLAFGGHLTASRFANYVSSSLDKILIGRYWNTPQLGFYAKADKAMVLPFRQVSMVLSRVAVPTLSRLQDDPSRYRKYFAKAVLLVATAGLPAVVFMVVDAGAIVRLILGRQWLDTIPILRTLAPVAIAGLVGTTNRWVFVSLGHAHRLLRWRLVESSFMVLGVVIAIRWGPIAVARALAVVHTALLVPSMAYCFRGSPVRVADVASTAWRPILAAAAASAGVLSLRRLGLVGTSPPMTLAIDGPVFAAVYLGAWMILPRGRATLTDLLRLTRELRG